jgi:hypothetical protein
VTDANPDDPTGTDALPQGSVVPGADIWDDVDDAVDGNEAWDDDLVVDIETRREIARSRMAEAEWDDQTWLTEAQVVAHVDDDGVHDGSRGVEADDDETTEAFGTKIQRWGTTSMLGASLSGLGFGIQKVLNPRETLQIEIQVDDDSDDHLDPVEVKLGENPDESVAVLRPWLRDRNGGSTGEQ